ncbi:MAG: NUDIX domain-containing protein [Candidatus Babeliales bacterium]
MMHLQEDQSFGIIPLKKEGNRWVTFIIRHKAGHWGFPKGHADSPDENPRQAAQRELAEETGLFVEKYLSDQSVSTVYMCMIHGKKVSKTVTYFLAQVGGDVHLCPQETIDGMWIDVDCVGEKIIFAETEQLIAEIKNLL